MYSTYACVIDSEIKTLNVKRGGLFQGRRLGKSSSDEAYKGLGLYPVITCSCESCSSGQKKQGPSYTWDADAQVVLKEYTIIDVDFDVRVTTARAALSALRYTKEIAGVTVTAVAVATDRESRACLTDRMDELAKKTAGTTINWKIPGDGCMAVTSDTLKSWQEAVSEYTQLCIDRECELIPLVEADPDTDITTGWPTQEIE